MSEIYMYGDITVSDDEVTISRERYNELIENDRWLDCLEAAGVDNWEGVDFAQEIFDSFNQ